MQIQECLFMYLEPKVIITHIDGRLIKYENNNYASLFALEFGNNHAHNGSINCVKISECGTYALSFGDDKKGHLWNI